MRNIVVTGVASKNIEPTIMKISLSIKGLDFDLENAVRMCNNDTNALKKAIERIGFRTSDLKTERMNIEPKKKSYRDANGAYKTRFIGFEYRHSMFLEFPYSNKTLNYVLMVLLGTKISFEFSVSNTITKEEKKEYTLEVMKDAVFDAKKKAMVLASAAGVRICDIETITYGDSLDGCFDDLALRSQEMKSCGLSEASMDFSLDAKDIEICDEVRITYTIE